MTSGSDDDWFVVPNDDEDLFEIVTKSSVNDDCAFHFVSASELAEQDVARDVTQPSTRGTENAQCDDDVSETNDEGPSGEANHRNSQESALELHFFEDYFVDKCQMEKTNDQSPLPCHRSESPFGTFSDADFDSETSNFYEFSSTGLITPARELDEVGCNQSTDDAAILDIVSLFEVDDTASDIRHLSDDGMFVNEHRDLGGPFEASEFNTLTHEYLEYLDKLEPADESDNIWSLHEEWDAHPNTGKRRKKTEPFNRHKKKRKCWRLRCSIAGRCKIHTYHYS